MHLRRAFGLGNTKDFDPVLLLDDFGNDIPEDYLAGFPWHPHRGIETITYVLAGTVAHGDNIGNSGVTGAGDVQWMTAGGGIIHQEMPKGDHVGRMHRSVVGQSSIFAQNGCAPLSGSEIPRDTGDHRRRWSSSASCLRKFLGKKGPMEGIAADPVYLDVSVSPGKRKALPVETVRHAFAYVFAGGGKFCNASGSLAVPTEAIRWLDPNPPGG